jgi:hypothetical protein
VLTAVLRVTKKDKTKDWVVVVVASAQRFMWYVMHMETQWKMNLVGGFKGKTVLADKGYDSQEVINFIERSGGVAVIPPRSNSKKPRDIDRELYKEIHMY